MGLFSGLFWGVFLLAAGVILLLKYAMKLTVSSGKLIFGVFIILLGVSLLTTNTGKYYGDNTVVFSDTQTVNADNDREYYVFFGSSHYELSTLKPGDHVKINCAFGSAKVSLPANAVLVQSNCAFGNVRMPDGSSYPFGTGRYEREGDNPIVVEVSCAFGEVSVYESVKE